MYRPRLLGALLVSATLCCAPADAQAIKLPDGRVYELVSPAETSGGVGGVFPLASLTSSQEQYGRPLQSSVNGEAIAYLGEDFYEPRLGSLNQYLSRRGAGGWSTQNLTRAILSPNEIAAQANPFVAFSPDLSQAIISSQAPLAAGAPPGFANLYLSRGAELEPLLTSQPQDRTAETFGHAWYGWNTWQVNLLFAGANSGSADAPAFGHILFEANDALTPKEEGRPKAVDGGQLENNLYEWVAGHLRLVNILPTGETQPNASFGVDNSDVYGESAFPNLSDAISADGSKIFWTDENTGNLYVREDGERTRQIDAAVGGGGEFQTASTDGSRAFFTKEGNLYQFSTGGGTTIELVRGGVEGLLGASQDGSYVYFVSTAVLDGRAVEGQPNLYLAHEGKVVFIATLSPTDDVTPNLYGTAQPYGDWFRTFAGRTAEVSPNGEYVAFMAKENLTGYDNLDAAGGQYDYEVFVYDATTQMLTCASCNTDGTRPTEDSLLPAPVDGVYQQRYLTDNGRLFFSTKDAVLPQDTNGESDVYEYESGHVYLISPGAANAEAVFADASETGNDVFFTTSQPLVPSDGGEITDLYDARVGGRNEEQTASACLAEACHLASSTPPSFGAPTSATFVGAGNLMPKALAPAQHKRKTHPARRKKRGRSKRRATKSSKRVEEMR
jgi:hypothetical protein